MQKAFLGTKDKFFRFEEPHLRYTLDKTEEGFVLTLQADALARMVEIRSTEYDFVASDNYFDLTDGSPKRVLLRMDGDADTEALADSLCLCCVYDIDK